MIRCVTLSAFRSFRAPSPEMGDGTMALLRLGTGPEPTGLPSAWITLQHRTMFVLQLRSAGTRRKPAIGGIPRAQFPAPWEGPNLLMTVFVVAASSWTREQPLQSRRPVPGPGEPHLIEEPGPRSQCPADGSRTGTLGTDAPGLHNGTHCDSSRPIPGLLVTTTPLAIAQQHTRPRCRVGSALLGRHNILRRISEYGDTPRGWL